MSIDPKHALELREQIAALNRSLASGDSAAFAAELERLVTVHRGAHDEPLAPGANGVDAQLRQLTHDAQAALERFRNEAHLDALAEHEVPDARQRLDHVVKLTDEAAHRTLDLVERSGPLADHAARESAALGALWRELTERDQNLFDSREVVGRVQLFLDRTRTDAEALRASLAAMLLAQGYQDLTGQIIRGVTRLVTELESMLGQLVLIADGVGAPRATATAHGRAVSAQSSQKLSTELRRGAGPAIPGINDADTMAVQNDIGALLSVVAAGAK